MPQAAIQGPPLTIDELLDLPEIKYSKNKKKFHALLLGFCAKGEHNHCANKVKTIDNMTWVCTCECHEYVVVKRQEPVKKQLATRERNRQILLLWEKGWTQRAIAEKVGLTQGRIPQILREYGVPARKTML